MGQRVLRIGQEVGRNPHEKAELATAVGVESFHQTSILAWDWMRELRLRLTGRKGVVLGHS